MKLDSVAAKLEGDQSVRRAILRRKSVAGREGALHRTGAHGRPGRAEELSGRVHRSEQRIGGGLKVLIADLGANRLFAQTPENQFDTADFSSKSYSFDGDWGKAKISEQECRKASRRATPSPCRILEALIARLKRPRSRRASPIAARQKGQPFRGCPFCLHSCRARSPRIVPVSVRLQPDLAFSRTRRVISLIPRPS